MTMFKPRDHRAALLVATALGALACHGVALAQSVAGQDAPAQGAASSDVVVTAARTTRSAVALGAVEMQKIMPGVNPLKAIQTLPGVLFETADPWGNNEQNESIFVHGFSTQQLGYTLDNVPLGDQQYGNYNGLSPSRAVTSENVSRVVLSSGAGALGVASTSNLGGAIETFSSDPKHTFGATAEEVLGSYETTRTFLRMDSGDSPYGAGYISYLHQDARAWDFDGHQKGDQVNAKYVHDDSHGKLTLYADWQSKVEPNEDATSFGTQQTTAAASFTPYTRPFQYPNLTQELASLTNGAPPTSQGNNFSNYFSAAQRTDVLGYAKYDYNVSSAITWSNQVYYHYDYGRGIVAGPINQAGLPTLFSTYFPGETNAQLINLFGGTGLEVRTTEYSINRGGLLSNVDWQLGQHHIEAGIWYEHNDSTTHRVWYPFSAANNDLSPYDVPSGKSVFTQYAMEMKTDDVQIHLQDQWKILPNLLLQAGFKSSLQTATGDVLVQQKNLASSTSPTNYPSGTIVSNKGFLPQFGALWDATGHEQVFANIQQNLRQFIPYGAGSNFYGASPWSLSSQAAFNLFKRTVQPESSWTYELGVRSHRDLDLGVLTSVQGQASVYHVDFSNRLLNVAAYNFINPGAAILVNVGGVTTNGVDLAGTLNFGEHVHLYDAVSYNKSTYDSDYETGSTPVTVDTKGKWVPGTPDWLNKTILSTNYGPFEGQLSGDYVGRRYATYLNDLSVKSTFLIGLEASYAFTPSALPWLQTSKLSLNVTNLADTRGVSTVVPTSTSGGYQAYPLAPRMFFVTLTAGF